MIEQIFERVEAEVDRAEVENLIPAQLRGRLAKVKEEFLSGAGDVVDEAEHVEGDGGEKVAELEAEVAKLTTEAEKVPGLSAEVEKAAARVAELEGLVAEGEKRVEELTGQLAEAVAAAQATTEPAPESEKAAGKKTTAAKDA